MFIANNLAQSSQHMSENDVSPNMSESGEKRKLGHRGRSRESNSHNQGFAEAISYGAHQMQNMNDERQSNFMSQRTGHDSSRHYHQDDHYDRRDRRNKRY